MRVSFETWLDVSLWIGATNPASIATPQGQCPHRCRLDFAEEQFSITPGQAAVFYDGEVCLGGGLIQA